MEDEQNQVLDANFAEDSKLFDANGRIQRRRMLLPWWIKIFTWIFMVFGALVPVATVFGALGMQFQISLYGLETNNPISYAGLGLSAIFLLKGIVAFGLWTERDWALTLGKADAILGIIFCVFMMLVYPAIDADSGFNFSIRLELLLLVPFLIKLKKIEELWNNLPEGSGL